MVDWMPVLVPQASQVTLLIMAVAAINRWVGKSRPHLAHALWLVVLVKCVTPPIWSSPSGVFCWLRPAHEAIREPLAVEPPSRSWSELLVEAREFDLDDVTDRSRRRESSDEVEAEAASTELSRVRLRPVAEAPSPIASNKVEWPSALLGLWVSASVGVIGVAVVRWLRCWRMVRSAPQRDSAELSAQLDALAKQLRLRRRVRLIVTESRLGPAVIGLFRTTVLLPALIVDRLSQRSRHAPRDEPSAASTLSSAEASIKNRTSRERSAHHAERDGYVGPLAPILAHELLHVRRGDLWVGLLQTLAQAVWWCHPLVWWVNRRTTREAERCCDEEVLAELGCDPAAYARALVDVLELKRELKPVPVFPGVRPVEVTTQRLERIMQLGQGCQRRTPWWCWLLAGLAAAATWPGAAFVVTAEDPGERGSVSPPVSSSQNRGADAIPLANAFDEVIDLDRESKLGLAYRVRVLSGAEDDLRTLARKFNEKLIAKPGDLVVVEHDDLLRLLKEAQAFPLKLSSHPVATGRGRARVSIGDTATFPVPVEVTDDDAGTTTLLEQSREYGWRLTMQPLSVGIESLRLRVVNDLSRLNHDAAVKVRYRTTGEEKLIPGLDVHRINTTVELRNGQHLVFPITKVPNTDSQDVMLLMLQARLIFLDEPPQQPEPTPMNVPGPSIRRGVGGNSDSGVTGGAVLEDSDKAIPVGNIAEVRVDGNKLVPTDEILAMIKSKPGEPVSEKQVRADVRAIYSSRRFLSVEPRLVPVDKGVNLLFQVVERPLIERVIFDGAKRFNTQELEKLTELREGSPLDVSVNRDAVQRIEKLYRSKGYPWAKVELVTGSQRDDRHVIFEITEGPKVSVGTEQPPAKLQLDGLGQLVWQQGSWFVAVLPKPGSKLIDSGESPSRFRLNGRVSVYLSKSGDGFSNQDQVTILADALELSTDEDGQEFRLSGDVRLRGNGFDARCRSALLKTEPRPTGHEPEVFALLNGAVRIRQHVKSETTELEATRAMLLLHGTAITQLKTDDNGLVAVLRAPLDREDPLIRLGQFALARFSAEKIVSVNFEYVPLKEAIKQLAQSAGRNIVLDNAGLADESLTERVPITLSLDDVKLSSALKLMLDPLNLGYRIEESGVIVVTSQQRLKGQPIIVTYAVADLAVPVPKRVAVKQSADLRAANEESKLSDPAKLMPSQIQELIKLITSTCQPNSWEAVAGNGQIKANDSTLSLVVRQTRNVHDEIRDLLEQLRRLQDIQASLHVETLTVPADFWHKVGKDFDDPEANGQPIPQPQDKAAPRSVARLTKKGAALLRSLSRPESAPKVTLFNGQELEVLFGGESPTMRLGLKPVVSADHQMLRLQAAAMKPDAALDFAKLAAITLKSGDSLLLDVTEIDSAGPTAGVPILSKIPNQERLFKNTGKSDRRTLLLVTGSVVIVEEEEELLGIPK